MSNLNQWALTQLASSSESTSLKYDSDIHALLKELYNVTNNLFWSCVTVQFKSEDDIYFFAYITHLSTVNTVFL